MKLTLAQPFEWNHLSNSSPSLIFHHFSPLFPKSSTMWQPFDWEIFCSAVSLAIIFPSHFSCLAFYQLDTILHENLSEYGSFDFIPFLHIFYCTCSIHHLLGFQLVKFVLLLLFFSCPNFLHARYLWFKYRLLHFCFHFMPILLCSRLYGR